MRLSAPLCFIQLLRVRAVFDLLRLGVLIRLVIVPLDGVGEYSGECAIDIEALRELVQHDQLLEVHITDRAEQRVLPEVRICHGSIIVAKTDSPCGPWAGSARDRTDSAPR